MCSWLLSCDRCHNNPIVGPRFHRQGTDFDLCMGCFRILFPKFGDADDFQLFQAPDGNDSSPEKRVSIMLRDFYQRKKSAGTLE